MFEDLKKKRIFNSIKEFEREKQIGVGAFSKVFLAIHKASGIKYALKQINLNKLKNSHDENIQREIKIHSEQKHENIVKFFDFFQNKNFLYLVLEYLPGGNLFSFMRETSQLCLKNIEKYFTQCLDAIEYLHNKGVVLRDIKPENILLTKNKDKVKLCDFGWASSIEDKYWLKKKAGTYVYMAPEALQGQTQGPETDVWALGILLFEMLFDREPFPGKNSDEVLSSIRKGFVFSGRHIDNNLKLLISDVLKVNMNERISLSSLKRRFKNVIQEDLNVIHRRFYSNNLSRNISIESERKNLNLSSSLLPKKYSEKINISPQEPYFIPDKININNDNSNLMNKYYSDNKLVENNFSDLNLNQPQIQNREKNNFSQIFYSNNDKCQDVMKTNSNRKISLEPLIKYNLDLKITKVSSTSSIPKNESRNLSTNVTDNRVYFSRPVSIDHHINQDVLFREKNQINSDSFFKTEEIPASVLKTEKNVYLNLKYNDDSFKTHQYNYSSFNLNEEKPKVITGSYREFLLKKKNRQNFENETQEYLNSKTKVDFKIFPDKNINFNYQDETNNYSKNNLSDRKLSDSERNYLDNNKIGDDRYKIYQSINSIKLDLKNTDYIEKQKQKITNIKDSVSFQNPLKSNKTKEKGLTKKNMNKPKKEIFNKNKSNQYSSLVSKKYDTLLNTIKNPKIKNQKEELTQNIKMNFYEKPRKNTTLDKLWEKIQNKSGSINNKSVYNMSEKSQYRFKIYDNMKKANFDNRFDDYNNMSYGNPNCYLVNDSKYTNTQYLK